MDKIMTLHPQGKAGVNIEKDKYEVMKKAIVSVLEKEGKMRFLELRSRVERELEGKFEGSVSWYYTTVKLDLEARGVLGREKGKEGQMVGLK